MLINNDNGLISIKNFNNIYIATNENYYRKCLRFNDKNELLGYNDEKVAEHAFRNSPCTTQEWVDFLIEEDEEAFRGNSLFVFDVQVLHGTIQFFMTHKSPYYNDKGKISGVKCHTIMITNPPIDLINNHLNNPLIHISDCSKKNIETYFNQTKSFFNVSHQELECIKFLAQGYTTKMIANQLNISVRTVDTHLENARIKLRCQNRCQLVAKSLTEKILELEENPE